MPKWSTLRGSNTVFGDDTEAQTGEVSGYVIHIPPPSGGPSRPASAVDICAIDIPHITAALDTTRHNVAWYEVLVTTASHQWSVLKRFSEFHDLRVSLVNLGFAKLARRLLSTRIALPPSRLRLASSVNLAKERREKLVEFLNSLLQVLKDLSVIAVTGTYPKSVCADEATIVTRAAYNIFLQFLTTVSHNVTPASRDRQQNQMTFGGDFASKKAVSQLAVNNDSFIVPPAKIVHLPQSSFSIVLQLPGVSMSSVYVDTCVNNSSREIVVGGSWNECITTPAKLLTENCDLASISTTDDECESFRERGNEGSAGPETILIDLFPKGDFLMHFEVPLPFEIDEWESQYISGVMFLTWKVPAQILDS